MTPKAGRWSMPAVLVVLAVIVRIAVAVADAGYEPRHDAFDYHRHGISISAGEGFPESILVPDGGPSALRAPSYPYLLGTVYAVLGDSVTTGQIANAFLGGLVVLLVFLIANGVWGSRVALVAAGLTAVFPPLVWMSRELFSESLFLVVELAAVLAMLAFRRSGGALKWAAAAGALCGLAALTRSPGTVLVVPIALGAWWGRPLWSRASLAGPVTVVACAALVIAPWTLRNEIEFGRFIPVTTSTGFALAGTYNETSEADSEHPAAWRSPARLPQYGVLFRTPGVDEGTLDATLRREAIEFAWQHPGYVVEAGSWNLLRLLHFEGGSVVDLGEDVTQPGIGSRSLLVERVSVWLTLPLAVLGALLLGAARLARRAGRVRLSGSERRLPTGPWFLWLVPIALLVVTVPIAGLPRYRAPLDPFVLLLAAIALVWLFERLIAIARRPGPTAALLAGVVAIAIAGCGDDDRAGGAATTTSPTSTEAESRALPKEKYTQRAEAICRDALGETRRLGQRFLVDVGKRLQRTAPEMAVARGLVAPGLRIRERQADRIRRLPPPAEQSEALDDYLALFDPLEELSRQRIRAGLAGDTDETTRLDRLMRSLADEQAAAAKSYGMRKCSVDFLQTAFPSQPTDQAPSGLND